MYYVNNRWLGGTLTNFQTVKKSIDRLSASSGPVTTDASTSSPRRGLDITRRIDKMDRALGGIKKLKGAPSIMFVDPKREHIAVREARKLGIPLVALCDTNCDPQGIAHVIPGNDDAIKSIRLFTAAIADAVIDGRQMSRENAGDNVVASYDVGDVEIYRKGGEAAEPLLFSLYSRPPLFLVVASFVQKEPPMAISAADIKALRQRTGAGILDRKKALNESDGVDKAIDWLRAKGIAKAAKKAGRAATEGLCASYIHANGKIVLLEVNCETDFVAKTDAFVNLVNDIAMHIAAAAPEH